MKEVVVKEEVERVEVEEKEVEKHLQNQATMKKKRAPNKAQREISMMVWEHHLALKLSAMTGDPDRLGTCVNLVVETAVCARETVIRMKIVWKD